MELHSSPTHRNCNSSIPPNSPPRVLVRRHAISRAKELTARSDRPGRNSYRSLLLLLLCNLTVSFYLCYYRACLQDTAGGNKALDRGSSSPRLPSNHLSGKVLHEPPSTSKLICASGLPCSDYEKVSDLNDQSLCLPAVTDALSWAVLCR